MKIVLAPDSYKGSLSSVEFCEIAEEAVRSIDSRIEVLKIPMADGGEGTVECVAQAASVETIRLKVHGPLMEEVEAAFCITGGAAVIELAQASGLPLVPEGKRNPMLTTTYGTGELIRQAMDRGCGKIYIGLGGSATNDGGMGLLSALGVKFLDQNGHAVPQGAQGLSEISSVDISGMDSRIGHTEFIGVCDVENPLCGENGASYVFGPQKGAAPGMIAAMDESLKNYARVVAGALGKDVSAAEGAGAAGGAGAGIMAFLGAKLASGAEFIKEISGLNQLLKAGDIDLVITGEGEINYQTAFGKLPCKVAEEAQKYGIPVAAIVGTRGQGAEKTHRNGVSGIFSIVSRPMTLGRAIEDGRQLVYDAVSEVVRFMIAVREHTLR